MEAKQAALLAHWQALLGAAEEGARAAQGAHAAVREAAQEAAAAAALAAEGAHSPLLNTCRATHVLSPASSTLAACCNLWLLTRMRKRLHFSNVS